MLRFSIFRINSKKQCPRRPRRGHCFCASRGLAAPPHPEIVFQVNFRFISDLFQKSRLYFTFFLK